MIWIGTEAWPSSVATARTHQGEGQQLGQGLAITWPLFAQQRYTRGRNTIPVRRGALADFMTSYHTILQTKEPILLKTAKMTLDFSLWSFFL